MLLYCDKMSEKGNMRKGRFNWELAFRELQSILVRKTWEHETKAPHIPTSYKTVTGIGTQVISFKGISQCPVSTTSPNHSTASPQHHQLGVMCPKQEPTGDILYSNYHSYKKVLVVYHNLDLSKIQIVAVPLVLLEIPVLKFIILF